MEPLTIGFIGLGLFVFLILAGVPIAFTALVVGIGGVYAVSGFEEAMRFAGYMPFAVTSKYVVSVIPLFIIMGYFAFHAGITKDLFWAARQWFGHLPGGLAIASVFGSAGFGACSGSTVASATVFGKIAVPELREYGYQPSLACGCVAASGTMAAMIPPSTILVIYGLLAETSIAALLIAGILPGILEAVSYSTMLGLRVALNPKLGRPQPAVSWKERFLAVKGVWGVSLLVVLIIGGMYIGIFTPTEAGAIGALGAFAIALFTRGLTWATFKESLLDTARSCAMLLLIFAGILIFMRFLALSGVTIAITDFVLGLSVPPLVTLVMILLVGIVYGFFLSSLGAVILIVPVFLPVIITLGFNPIVFGILLVRVAEVGSITPPVGTSVYAVKAVVPDVPVEDIFRGILPFAGVDVINIAMLIAFPQIILFLPSMM
jgi:tripartite ATP-independent transporter DctM subunit